jgi:hypothetical protein
MLTPLHCCIQVALSINRATCSFDTSHSRYPVRRAWGSAVYFWGIASTKGNFVRDRKSQRGRVVLSIGEISRLHKQPGRQFSVSEIAVFDNNQSHIPVSPI